MIVMTKDRIRPELADPEPVPNPHLNLTEALSRQSLGSGAVASQGRGREESGNHEEGPHTD